MSPKSRSALASCSPHRVVWPVGSDIGTGSRPKEYLLGLSGDLCMVYRRVWGTGVTTSFRNLTTDLGCVGMTHYQCNLQAEIWGSAAREGAGAGRRTMILASWLARPSGEQIQCVLTYIPEGRRRRDRTRLCLRVIIVLLHLIQ